MGVSMRVVEIVHGDERFLWIMDIQSDDLSLFFQKELSVDVSDAV
jgi:hypothetical protein